MKPYSMDLRQRVLDACDRGEGTKATAKRFGVSAAWVRRLKQHRRVRGGVITPRPGGGSRGRKFDRAKLATLVARHPDATPAELRDRLGVDVTTWSICKALRALGLSYKKVAPRRRAGPPGRRRGAGGVAREPAGPGPRPAGIHRRDPRAKTNMTRTRGRSPVGERLVAAVPHGHWRTPTLVAALDRRRGMRCSMVLDGAVNGMAFARRSSGRSWRPP
jgi:transposase